VEKKDGKDSKGNYEENEDKEGATIYTRNTDLIPSESSQMHQVVRLRCKWSVNGKYFGIRSGEVVQNHLWS
jgi:hypothetical protein